MLSSRRARAITAAVGLTVALTATSAHASTVSGSQTAFVISGSDAPAGAYPFMVFLRTVNPDTPDQSEICGGTLIARDWVLTAAHCTQVTPPTKLVARYGATDLSTGDGVEVDVAQIVDHPQYDRTTLANDLSLLRLAQPIDGPTVALVQPGQEALWSAGTTATLAGWGGTSSDEQNQVTPDRLQHVQMPISTDAACGQALGPDFDPAVQFCAGDPKPAPDAGPDACRGDSGGPLLVRDDAQRWLQVGAVSFGATCGNTLTAYTRLANYSSFIAETVGAQQPRPATFTDIAGSPHRANIELIAGKGVAGGYSDGTYRPANPVSRGQMATFLMRALNLPPGDPNTFPDAASSPHAAAIGAVAAAGIAGGFSDGTYRADVPVNRGQMASFIARGFFPAAG